MLRGAASLFVLGMNTDKLLRSEVTKERKWACIVFTFMAVSEMVLFWRTIREEAAMNVPFSPNFLLYLAQLWDISDLFVRT